MCDGNSLHLLLQNNPGEQTKRIDVTFRLFDLKGLSMGPIGSGNSVRCEIAGFESHECFVSKWKISYSLE